MTLSRRLWLATLPATALGLAGWPPAAAQPASPGPTPFTRPLRLVVPNAPGGAADLTARAVGQRLAEALGQPVLVDNKPGAGGVMAAETVARAAPDGHTLLLISSGTAVSAALFRTLPFDTLRDFVPVAPMATFDLAIVAAEGGRWRSLAEWLAWARAHPGQLNLGTPAIGTTQHLAAELLKAQAGLDVQVVPFNGTPAVVNALRAGQIDAGLDILGPLLAQIRARALVPLAVTGERRARVLPEVPTVRESGVAGYQVSSWNGLAVPAGTPRERVLHLNREVVAALGDPVVRRRLEDLTLEPHPGSPEQAAALLAGDVRRWGEVIARARIPRQ